MAVWLIDYGFEILIHIQQCIRKVIYTGCATKVEIGKNVSSKSCLSLRGKQISLFTFYSEDVSNIEWSQLFCNGKLSILLLSFVNKNKQVCIIYIYINLGRCSRDI